MPEQSPAAWQPDPYGRYEFRYWDGGQWTDHVMSQGRQGVDPGMERLPAAPTANTPSTPAAWYPDPFARHEQRYWDANRWTDHVYSRGLQAVDAAVPQAGSPTVGRPVNASEWQARPAQAAHAEGFGTLLTEQVLVVNQKAKLLGSKVEYAIFNQAGRELGRIQELRRDLSTKLSDSLRGRTDSNRTHRFQVVDINDRVLLAMTRPAMGWFKVKGRLVIEGPQGGSIGQIVHESFGIGGSIATTAHAGISNASAIARVGLGGIRGMVAGGALEGVQQRLTSAVEGLDKVGHARFGLESGGQRVGSVHAESIKEWDFRVQDPRGTEVARITKTWAGWAKERFTKADNYVVQMHRPLEEPLRSLVIASALAIDFEFKQRGDQTSGSSVWGTRRYK